MLVDDLANWSWNQLNEALKELDEETCHQLLEAEVTGKKRKMFALRIHSRLNKVRADNERVEILEQINEC